MKPGGCGAKTKVRGANVHAEHRLTPSDAGASRATSRCVLPDGVSWRNQYSNIYCNPPRMKSDYYKLCLSGSFDHLANEKGTKSSVPRHELTCCLERGILHLQRPLHKHKALSGDMQAARPQQARIASLTHAARFVFCRVNTKIRA